MVSRRTFTVWLLAVLLASSGLDAFRASMKAMACCVRSHQACAGIDTPDDCCQRMGHTSSASPSMVTASHDQVSMATVAVLPVAAMATVVLSPRRWLVEPTFKRPHDPPHLHPVPLLI